MHMEEENVLCISLPQNEIINFQWFYFKSVCIVYQKYCSNVGGSSSNVVDTILP
jgi:hypothetical protein